MKKRLSGPNLENLKNARAYLLSAVSLIQTLEDFKVANTDDYIEIFLDIDGARYILDEVFEDIISK